MLEYLSQLDHGKLGLLLGLVAIIGSMLTVVSAVGLVQWRKRHEAEMEAQLKMQMLDQNMSAVDIATIIEAGKKKRRDWKQLHKEFHDAHARR